MNLTETEKEILECWLSSWSENQHKLYGHINYKDVANFIDKLELERPKKFEEIMDGTFERWASSLIKDLV
jgi:hypothetical protein